MSPCVDGRCALVTYNPTITIPAIALEYGEWLQSSATRVLEGGVDRRSERLTDEG